LDSLSSTSNNRRTVAAYERYAQQYAAAVGPHPSDGGAAGLQRLARGLPAGSAVLEIGSGPGWDADYLEGLGIGVKRTDVTAAFRAVQSERGKQVDPLDLLTDELGGPYPGIVMLAVIQHVERRQVVAALRKVSHAIADGGLLLMSHPIGAGAYWEHGTSGDYRVVHWPSKAMDERMAGLGLTVEWEQTGDGEGGLWRTALARKKSRTTSRTEPDPSVRPGRVRRPWE
jgi:2-polyprenyl-3-methyl-5-hydroxy-6-metoxy-1,4-benzoquinol methylase